jgi:hypothetical protein
VVLLEGRDSPNTRPGCAAVHAIGGGGAVNVALAFLLAGCAGVVDVDGMMAAGETVPAHVACEPEPAAVTATTVAAAAIATDVTTPCVGVKVLFHCHHDCF